MRFPRPDPARAALYHERGDWREDTIPQRIAASAACLPEKVAVRDAQGKAMTYRELMAASASVAGHLSARDIGKGDIVTVCLPNWCETVVTFLAIMRLGAVVNPVPVTYGRADIDFVLRKCDSRALFLPGRFRSTDYAGMAAGLIGALTQEIEVIQVGPAETPFGTRFEALLGHAPINASAMVEADDPVAVLFTSGTESRPKGGVHTHNTILFGETALARALGLGAADVAFMASPISHTTGFMHGVVMTLMLGGTLVLLDVFEGQRATHLMQAHDCTWTMGATPFLADVTQALEDAGGRLPCLRYFMCGGAPIPEALVRRAAGVDLRTMSIYGSTESPPHTLVHPDDPIENSWSTDGRPLAGIEVRIVDSAGADVDPGEVGEEWSRGPNTFLGYLGEPELSAKDLDAEGWYHSGDLARRLPDGSIRIAGRLKDIIVRGGQNISVREVEDHISAHPAVRMVAVVAVAHERLGETACAVVVTRPGKTLDLAGLTEFLIGKGIARFKLPERLEVWPALPQTPSGKIQKFLIRRQLTESGPGASA